MDYDLVFDSAQSGYRNWAFAAGGLPFVVIGALLVKNRRNLPAMFPGGMGPKTASAFAYAFLVFSVVGTAVAFTTTGREYSTVLGALRRGEAEIVEGRVENFVPMPYTGHAMERFSVCGVPSSYSDYVVTTGFNQTSSHGGPIRPGLWVRLAYVGNTIGRVEIAKIDPAAETPCRRGSGLTGR